MKMTSVSELSDNLNSILAFIEQGEKIQIMKGNIPIACIVPCNKNPKNRTRLGCGMGTVKINSDLTEAMIAEKNWELLKYCCLSSDPNGTLGNLIIMSRH